MLSTRTSLFNDVVHGEEGIDEREGRAGALGCGRDADGLRGGVVYVVGDRRTRASLVACGRVSIVTGKQIGRAHV